MALATNVSLSTKDTQVLHALFDAEASMTQPAVVEHSEILLPGFSNDETSRLRVANTSALQPITTVKHPSPTAAESAIQALSELIGLHPRFAPAYLDRAQAYRLLVEDEQLFNGQQQDTLDRVVADLSTAIRLASPGSPNTPVSDFQASLLSKAHTHLAYLLLKLSNSGSVNSVKLNNEDTSTETLEEMAAHHFRLGGVYGNDVARDMAVQTNPYAKLCGAIVKEALKQEIEEYISS